MSFSEFQYSNRNSVSTGEVWTKESDVIGLEISDSLDSGMQITVTIANPQGRNQASYAPYRRVRVLDRPSNAVIFLGRVVDIANDHRRQRLTVACQDYTVDISTTSVPSSNLFGNRRSDIVTDVISGGIEKGRTLGVSGKQDYIVDSSKKFDSSYIGKIVKVEGIGPGRVASGSSGSTLNTDNYGTSTTGPFNDSHVGRMIRRFRSYRDTSMDPVSYTHLTLPTILLV